MRELARLEELKRLLPQGLLKDQLRIGWRLAEWLARQRHGGQIPTALESWLAEARNSVALRQERQARLPRLHYPPELPIAAKRADIVEAIRKHQVLIVAGETGSGKTTQLPKMCLEAGFGVRAQIGCTQPRRIAALSLSRRLAEELDLQWGREVGCKIRFSDQTGPATYVKFMTDGMLLAEAQGDPFLADYEVIIIDEAHERSLNIDFLLGILQQLLPKRDDLKLIITSATIDTHSFSRAFNDAPIIEVSGRMYPVETLYAPFDEPSDEGGDVTYIDAAVNAVEELTREPAAGDVLVFMPSERDILETRDALQQRNLGAVELIPLFGRLSADEQQRVFAPSRRRKIVIATNIAETSLTVPGIRYVVDTGLARFSRYNARTRTKRLPIEPVSQSSANQRQGRCGRVAKGLCLRLFSEADFQARPPYTQPEIQRANLAEVILRMKAFKLGDIETFPFLNPPSPPAIQGGYQLLQELGALDAERGLTPIGADLARLPVDPTIGRMILQAHKEKALHEVLIIAAGLSIQDPRERPAERQGTADAAHRRFHHPRSDFISLLNIWNAFHDTLESLKTQHQTRKFCREHFLSYPRMREWRDIHAQLQDALEDLGGFNENPADATFEAIHRAILTGLWGHVSVKTERNLYQLSGNRQAMIFPGSGLFQRPEAKSKSSQESPAKPAGPKPVQPQWLMAGEIVETSRLFLRTVAEIDPVWIVELAPHLCQRTVKEPRWDVATGRVLARERITFKGLEVLDQTIAYGPVNPTEATALFIRRALVEAGLAEHLQGSRQKRAPTGPLDTTARTASRALESPDSNPPEPDLRRLPAIYQFLAHNHQLRQKIEIWQTRQSHRVAPDLDETFFQAYAREVEGVSSVPDLNRWLRSKHATHPRFLCFNAADLLGPLGATFDGQAFPDAVAVGDQAVALSYAYAPGDEQDGVTVKLPFTLAQVIDPALLDWAVPGLREPRILHLLQALPKELRRPLMPLPPKARELAETVRPEGGSLIPALTEQIRHRYGVSVPSSAWQAHLLPAHLRPRFEILGQTEKPLAVGRDLAELKEKLRHHDTTAESKAWQAAVQQWERYGLTDWNFGDLPESIVVSDVAGFPLSAFPALQFEEGEVCLRLFRHPEDALKAQAAGVPRLAERVLQRELAWLQKDLRSIGKWKDLYITLGPAEELETSAFENLKRHLLAPSPSPPRTAAAFQAMVARVRDQLPGLVPTLVSVAGEILQLRQVLLLCRKPYPGLLPDLNLLVPRQFLSYLAFTRLPQLPRYLKAMRIRAERAALSPAKDAEKLKRVQPFLTARHTLLKNRKLLETARAKVETFFWLVEEFKVSIFAQELGTAEPVSPPKLEHLLAELTPRPDGRTS